MTITLTRRPAAPLAPFADPFRRLRQEMAGMLEPATGELFGFPEPGYFRTAGWSPAVDISETDKELVVRAECPGIKDEDLEVSVTGDSLVIAGQKNEEATTGGEDWTRCERRFGSFRRVIGLPETVDADRAQADAAAGVVTIRIPKRPEAKPRTISITHKGK